MPYTSECSELEPKAQVEPKAAKAIKACAKVITKLPSEDRPEPGFETMLNEALLGPGVISPAFNSPTIQKAFGRLQGQQLLAAKEEVLTGAEQRLQLLRAKSK